MLLVIKVTRTDCPNVFLMSRIVIWWCVGILYACSGGRVQHHPLSGLLRSQYAWAGTCFPQNTGLQQPQIREALLDNLFQNNIPNNIRIRVKKSDALYRLCKHIYMSANVGYGFFSQRVYRKSTVDELYTARNVVSFIFSNDKFWTPSKPRACTYSVYALCIASVVVFYLSTEETHIFLNQTGDRT